jgi:hypothetical protein
VHSPSADLTNTRQGRRRCRCFYEVPSRGRTGDAGRDAQHIGEVEVSAPSWLCYGPSIRYMFDADEAEHCGRSRRGHFDKVVDAGVEGLAD